MENSTLRPSSGLILSEIEVSNAIHDSEALSGIITGDERKGETIRFKKIEVYLILGCYLAVGAFLGYSIGKEKPAIKPNTATVDVVKEGDEILIYEHYTGELVFEYNKDKELDKETFWEYGDLLLEVQSKK